MNTSIFRTCAFVFVASTGLTACQPPAVPPEPVRAVKIMSVGDQPGASIRDYAAEVKARVETRQAFRVGGKVVERKVQLGDHVRAGQCLATLDGTDLAAAQGAATAAAASALEALNLAKADHERFKQLREQGFISSAEFQRREVALSSAQAQWSQANAQATIQGRQSQYACLTAEVSGVVTSVDVEPGMVLSAGTPVLRIAQDGPRDAVFSIAESQWTEFQSLLGKAGAMRVRILGEDTETPATLRELSAAADPVSRTFQARADVGAERQWTPGRSAVVRVASAGKAGADAGFLVPISAVREDKGQSAVWILDESRMAVKSQVVQVLRAEGNFMRIGSGLQVGQKLVTVGVHALVEGQKVSLYQERQSKAAPLASSPSVAPAK